MNKRLYSKLAWNNICKNKSTFYPFLIAVITLVGMFYMITSIAEQSAGSKFSGDTAINSVLFFGTFISAILSVAILFYTNSFLIKRRTKELGLYNILGLEKKHIGHILFWEIMIVGGIGIISGMVAGIVLSKLFFLLFLKLMKLSVTIRFSISVQAIIKTVVLFGITFIVIICCNRIRISFLKPVDMLGAAKAGEKEPKAKWIMTLLGFVCLGAGYYISMTTKNPIDAMSNFFIAVLLVIVGTELLFIAGSVTLLKLLKKNKNFYYHKTHFITVSGMMYRMKQNAVGLANICILSTAVLVVLSTTVSLYIGIDDEMRNRFPTDVGTDYIYTGKSVDRMDDYRDRIQRTAADVAKQKAVSIQEPKSYFSFGGIAALDGNTVNAAYVSDSYLNVSNMTILNVYNVDEFNKMHKTDYQVNQGAVILSCKDHPDFNYDTVSLAKGVNWKVQQVEKGLSKYVQEGDYCDEVVLLVSGMEDMLKMADQINEIRGKDNAMDVIYNYDFNLTGKLSNKKDYCKCIGDNLKQIKDANLRNVEDIHTTRQDFVGVYAGLLFIGLFIGTLFLIATVLIIYYKQISEGYDDRNNFQIMQKVGMGKSEVKHVINSQVIMVFLLPIVVAVIHLVFAFRIIRKLLAMANLTNLTLFIGCTIGTIIVFVLVYIIVYRLTSKTYYRIVNS